MAEIKVVIFDLDDTLYDSEQIRDSAREQSVKAMIEKGLKCSQEEGIKRLIETNEKNPIIRFKKFVDCFNCNNDEIAKAGLETYINSDFGNMEIYPEVKEVLNKLGENNLKIILITQGSSEQQNKKIDVLDVRGYFNDIFVPKIGDKERYFLKVLNDIGVNASEIIVVGDNIGEEIRIGNKLGMKTVRLLKGAYKDIKPKNDSEKPDYNINNLMGLFDIINNKDKKKLKIVAIGGGTGLPTIVEGLREYTDDLTMIVTVTDSGRSSGILRRELDVLPPGDIKNCLIALSNSEKTMCDLFQYRFDNGSLNGHSFGNLFIAALTKLTGSFEKAVEEASRILKLKGRVLPSTLDNVHICVELEDGKIIEEEDNIIDRNNDYVHLRPKIKKVFLKPNALANEKVLEAIKEADLIVLCPGSLFTSVITNLLVDGVSDAVRNSQGKKVYVCNIMTQVSQTHGYKASEHVQQVINYLGRGLDYVVLNSGKPSEELLESYKKENAFLVENDVSVVEDLGVKVIVEDLLDDIDEKKLLWEKKDLLRHNPEKVADVLIRLVQ